MGQTYIVLLFTIVMKLLAGRIWQGKDRQELKGRSTTVLFVIVKTCK